MPDASNFRATERDSDIEPALLMVGIAIPPEMMAELAARDRYPGIQGHNHQWAVIRGIEEAAGRPMDLLSVAAIGDYPRHPALVMRGGRWQHRPGATDVWLPFVNLFPFKQMTRFLVVWAGIVRWLWRHRRSKRRVVFLYSTQSPQLYAMLLATLFANACKIAIMADPPSVDLPSESLFRKVARRIDRWLQRKALQRLQGLVVLAEPLATDFAPGVPYQVVEGIAPDISARPGGGETETTANFAVMYAGGLIAEYGVQLLLDSLPLLPPDVELWIYGRGRYEEDVRKCADKDSRLKFFGFRPNEEVRDAARRAGAMVNPRPSAGWFTRYSFPSKVLEYMATGRPVISTRLPTIPGEYDPYLVWIEEESPEGFVKAVRKLQRMSPDERTAFGQKSREFVRIHKSERSQGAVIWQFTARIAGFSPCAGNVEAS